MKQYFVYIMTNHTNSTLYIGVTDNILRRVGEHKYKYNDGFAEKYNVYKLVYLEETNSVTDAIAREKQLKRWSRKKKTDLISRQNPDWIDLAMQ